MRDSDDEITFYLTSTGWQREGVRPADCLEVMVYCSPNKMWQKASFDTTWKTDDKAALGAAHKAHGYRPNPFGK
jgi:hypothetical protein